MWTVNARIRDLVAYLDIYDNNRDESIGSKQMKLVKRKEIA